jgi:hypothetical protein
VTITCSGLVYLLLVASLAAAAGPALVLLLAFMTGCRNRWTSPSGTSSTPWTPSFVGWGP